MINKRIKPGMQWANVTFLLLFTFNHKNIHSTTNYTPNDRRQQDNALATHINIELDRAYKYAGLS